MRKIILLLLLISYSFSFAQENYKYVIVPKKFGIFDEENKYNSNRLTKTFFESEGFQVFYDTDELPSELANNRCLFLMADAVENKTLFLIRVSIEIKDCANKVIHVSEIGVSKEKQFDKAYNVAFREALSSLKGKLNIKLPTQSLSESKNTKSSTDFSETKTTNSVSEVTLATRAGSNLVDKNIKRVLILQKTSLENVFIVKDAVFQGVVIKKNDEYFLEYYDNDNLVSEKVNVKF